MRKRICRTVTLFLVTVLTTMSATQIMPVNAEEVQEHGALLVDNAGILEKEQYEELEKKLEEVSTQQACDVVIVTVPNLEGKEASVYADDYYDLQGYGQGSDLDGILFLLDMGDRNWAISTSGFGITAFTDAGQEYIIEQISTELKDDDYYEAFEDFTSLCDEFLTQAKTGEAYDTDHLPKETPGLFWIPADLLIGLVIALIIGLIKKSKLTSVRQKVSAQDYVVPGSIRLTTRQDHLVNCIVTKKPIERQEENSGSSTHTSSQGKTHGGSSGKF